MITTKKDLLFVGGSIKNIEFQINKRLNESIFLNWKPVKIPAYKRRKLRKQFMLLCIKGKIKNPKKCVDTIMNAFEKGMTKEMGKLMGISPKIIKAHVR